MPALLLAMGELRTLFSKPTSVSMLPLLAMLLLAAASPAVAFNPRDYTDCESCVAVGYGWSITKQRCGGFKNKVCAAPSPVAPVDITAQAEAGAQPAIAEPTSSVAEKLAAKRAEEAARASLAAQRQTLDELPPPPPPPPREQTPEELAREADLYRLVMVTIGVFTLTLFVAYLVQGLCKACRRPSAGIPDGAATVKLDVKKVLFTQSSIEDTFRDGRSVDSMIEELRNGSLQVDTIPAIRVVRKHGCYFTLDHRRLYAMRQALGSNKKPADRTVTCILESFKNDEVVKEFKRKATTDNPTGITVNSTWLADWKPFVEATPPARRRGFRPETDVHADVDDLSMAKMTASPALRPPSWGTSRGVESPKNRKGPNSPKSGLAAARAQSALSKRFDEASSSESEEEEDEDEEESEEEEEEEEESEEEEEEEEVELLEPEPEPEPAKAPKGFTPKFVEPTVSKAAAPKRTVTNYEAAFARFEKLDKDGDGKISVEELISLGMTEEQARHEISEHDTDGDGSVSWGEYLEKKKAESQAAAAAAVAEDGKEQPVADLTHVVHDGLSFKEAALEDTS
jgi:hypothetical protein